MRRRISTTVTLLALFVLSGVFHLAELNAQAHRVEMPGWYGDRLPTGEFAVADGANVVTHAGNLTAPDELLFVRVTNVPRFKIAGKAHNSNATWVWDGEQWTDGGHSPGIQGHIWTPDGVLFFAPSCEGCDSQGIRYWDNGPVFGTPTYGPRPDLGVTRLYEWTKCGNVVIGQGENGGAVIQYRGRHWLLEPGDTRFIQGHCQGAVLAGAMSKPMNGSVVLFSIDERDIEALPAYTETPPQPPPPPSVECGTVPVVGQNALRELAARFPDLIRSQDEDERRQWALMAAEQMAFSVSPAWGSKKSSQTNPQTKDGIAKFVGTTLCVWDIVNGTTRELRFGEGEPVPGQVFIPVEPKNHLGSIDPPPPANDLRDRVIALEQVVRDLQIANGELSARLMALESRSNGVPEETVRRLIDDAFASARVVGGTSRDLFHGHRIDLRVVR